MEIKLHFAQRPGEKHLEMKNVIMNKEQQAVAFRTDTSDSKTICCVKINK